MKVLVIKNKEDYKLTKRELTLHNLVLEDKTISKEKRKELKDNVKLMKKELKNYEKNTKVK